MMHQCRKTLLIKLPEESTNAGITVEERPFEGRVARQR
jgi:hypothetical protein